MRRKKMIDKEKVRELLFKILSVNSEMDDKVIDEWLEQNQPEPVVVGLSDEQIISLGNFYESTGDTFFEIVKEWQKTQTFAQPEITKLEKEIAEMQISYIDLQRYCSELKSQQLKPSWDDAPTGAVKYEVVEYYKTEDGRYLQAESLHCEQRPQPTEPVVDVGQVWKHLESGRQYIVDEILVLDGETKLEIWNKDLTLVVYNPCSEGCKSKDIYRRTLSDFLAKFERIS